MHPVLHALISQTAPEAPSGPAAILGNPITMFVMMIAIFYFVLWRPQSKERKKLQNWLASVKKGDQVVTQSGIIGTVHLVEDKTVTLDAGGGNKLRILKSNIAGPWNPQEPAQPANTEAKK
ncbi:MAG: preprotein translocase subunit YajC [Anaeromyxobacter sp.]